MSVQEKAQYHLNAIDKEVCVANTFTTDLHLYGYCL